MDVARDYVALTRRKKALERDLAAIKDELDDLEPRILDLIEHEQLPASFKLDGASVFVREQLWASPLNKDHAALVEVLQELGLTEYLPRTVSSHSISAYVREHVDEETGEIVGLDPKLLAALKITSKVKAVVTG